jgi:PIN domain nuclease of toxin-antitoxin system
MLLIDTHIWIWWINQTAGRLPKTIVNQIEQADIVGISTISCFEITWLSAHNRIAMDIPIKDWLTQATVEAGIICIPPTCAIASLAAELPEHHKDPQDRLSSLRLFASSCN